jgi:hypothetical protein
MLFSIRIFGFSFFALSVLAAAPPPEGGSEQQIPLLVPAGTPLRLYLTKRLPKKEGAPVEAKVLDAVYSFDREVIPAGAAVLGRVIRVQSVSGAERTRAILNGDFTPLHVAPIEFTMVVLPDGRQMPLRTAETPGLNSIVSPQPLKKQNGGAPQNTGVLGTGKQKVEDAIQGKIARAKSIPDLVRGPDKKEKVEDYLMAKLPYHPQYVRKGTRLDAELAEPLSFGSEPVHPGSLELVGTQPPADRVAQARLITPLDSAVSTPGEKVEAVLAEPVYSADHRLILPEGTHLEGSVVQARRARWFHRSGQLRFNFKNIDLPEDVARVQEVAPVASTRPPQEKLKIRTEANLQAAENTGKAPLKIDGEGGVQANESKTRFLAAAAAVMVARRAGDNEEIRNGSRQIIGQSQNVGGRTIGGGFGFGLLGAGIAQSSRYVGTAFGYYGMAWALYSTVIARGSEVQFGKDAKIDIRFDTRSDKAASSDSASGAQPPAGRSPQ